MAHSECLNLPEKLALFPLAGVLLLPSGRLPLHVFEPRYLRMVEDAFARGRIIGVIQPKASHDGPLPDDIPLYDVGCAGRIVFFEESRKGTYWIALAGIHRFRRCDAAPRGPQGYRETVVDYTPFAIDRTVDLTGEGTPPAVTAEQDRMRKHLTDAARTYLEHRGIDADWDEMARAPLDSLVTTLAMNCPLDPREKQALLETLDPAQCRTLLVSLLAMANKDDLSPAPRTPH